jgi:mannose-6-phosphate isomerase-like protein (cupin superfamily)
MNSRAIAGILSLVAIFRSASAQPRSTDRIDMYFGDWNASQPHVTHGALEERDILTRGDPLNPTRKSAVLHFLNSYSRGVLPPNTSTTSTKLEGQQEIFYVVSGTGTAIARGESVDLHPNIAILVPAGLDFTLKNTASEPLTMYVINEPTPHGFRPNPKIVVKDENTLPITSSDGFWCHIVKTLFVTGDGLGTLQSVLTVTLDPLTIAQPHLVDHDDIEEVWAALQGNSLAFLGTQLRRQSPGVAYLHPPDNKTPHTNINYSEDEQVKFLYFARYHPHEPRK